MFCVWCFRQVLKTVAADKIASTRFVIRLSALRAEF